MFTLARRIPGDARGTHCTLAVKPATLTTFRHLLAHLAVTVCLAVVEPAWPLAHALVHVVIARRAAAVWGGVAGSHRSVGSVAGGNSVFTFVAGTCYNVSILSRALYSMHYLTGNDTSGQCQSNDGVDRETHLVD